MLDSLHLFNCRVNMLEIGAGPALISRLISHKYSGKVNLNVIEPYPEWVNYYQGFSCYFRDPLAFYFRLSTYKFFLRHIQEDDHVLDLACGDGLCTYMLTPKATHIKAVEINPEAVAYAKEYFAHPKIEYINPAIK